MKKLLIIDKHQFGYLTDSYKWCQYLKDEYEVSVICFDSKYERQKIEGVNVFYVNSNGNRIIRGLRFLLYTIIRLFIFKGKVIVVYFENCTILKKIFPFKKMILDIRTLSISHNQNQREKYNSNIFKACQIYDTITIISEGIKTKLNLTKSHVYILPLGADIISSIHKKYDPIKLLYVGTFTGRRIDDTIKGFKLFKDRNPDINITYDIIGFGENNELDYLKRITEQYLLDNYITFHGRIPYDKLKPYFEKCNIGVSFIPITDYYNHQPPTKTFEYILSGLYCIATSTNSNREIITKDNGILIKDTAIDFAYALEEIYKNIEFIKTETIRDSLKNYTWSHVIDYQLKPILNYL